MKNNDNIRHNLQERIKELTALHKTAIILQNDEKNMAEILQDITDTLPEAWQYPDITSAHISFEDMNFYSQNFSKSQWIQSADFITKNGRKGIIEIFYLKEKENDFEGPFLKEERDLINSLAGMLKTYFEHKIAEEALKKSHENLEQKVKKRTIELRKANISLRSEIKERKKAEKEIKHYEEQLRILHSELSLSEERERRAIASDLHDHIGQALAIIKLKLTELQGNAIFCGFENNISDIKKLLNQTIKYTRDLTFEISPPLLYELGLEAAIEWLAEENQKKYNLKIQVTTEGTPSYLSNEVRVILFKSAREVLINVAKHAMATHVNIHIKWTDDAITIQIKDNGIGFNNTKEEACKNKCFGLFNIRESLAYINGSLKISSVPGNGTIVNMAVSLKIDEREK